jgi:hypothetical protein
MNAIFLYAVVQFLFKNHNAFKFLATPPVLFRHKRCVTQQGASFWILFVPGICGMNTIKRNNRQRTINWWRQINCGLITMYYWKPFKFLQHGCLLRKPNKLRSSVSCTYKRSSKRNYMLSHWWRHYLHTMAGTLNMQTFFLFSCTSTFSLQNQRPT